MPGPRQKRKYVSGNPIKRRIKSTAVKGAKAVGKGAAAGAVSGFTRKRLAPFASAALKAAKGRSNNQHL